MRPSQSLQFVLVFATLCITVPLIAQTSTTSLDSKMALDQAPPAAIQTIENKQSWWHRNRDKIALAIFTSLLTYFVARRIHRVNKPRKKLVCSATYCAGLFADSAANLKGELAVQLNGKSLTDPTVICYRIESVGNSTITDVTMKLETMKNEEILRWVFHVDDDVKCRRLSTITNTPSLLEVTWSFINPGEALELVLLVAPCRNAHCIHLGIDAEGLEVDSRNMRHDCSVGF